MRPPLPLKPPSPPGSGKAGRETLLMHGEGRLARSGILSPPGPEAFPPRPFLRPPPLTLPAARRRRRRRRRRPAQLATLVPSETTQAASARPPIGCRSRDSAALLQSVRADGTLKLLYLFWLSLFSSMGEARARAADGGGRVVGSSRQPPRLPPHPGTTPSPAGPLPPAADPDAQYPSQ